MTKFALLAAAVAVTAAPAVAATYVAVYTSSGASPLTATLYLTTANTANVNGTYDITNIGGYVDTDHITALTPNPNQPNQSTSADGLFLYDNVFSPEAPYVTNNGPLFTSATHEYNLFSDSPTVYELYQVTPGVGYTENSTGTLTVTQVPEPAAWALFVAGFGLIGVAARRRATTVAA